MAPKDQPDLFNAAPQADLFGGGAAQPTYRPDLDKVRARIQRILGVAKAAHTFPWDMSRASLYRTIFPQLTHWLPEDEGARLRREFEAELARLQAA